jgi:hypothetical protein
VAGSDQSSSYDALKYSVRSGKLEEMNELISCGADVNGTSENGTTLLMLAAYYGLGKIAEALLEHGCVPDAVRNGKTAADIAWEGRFTTLAKKLDKVISDCHAARRKEAAEADRQKAARAHAIAARRQKGMSSLKRQVRIGS